MRLRRSSWSMAMRWSESMTQIRSTIGVDTDKPVQPRLQAIRRWFAQQLKRGQPREHAANVLPVHGLLTFVRLYGNEVHSN